MPSGIKRRHSQANDDDNNNGNNNKRNRYSNADNPNMSVSTGIDGLTSEYNSPKGERAAKRARKQRRRKNEPEEDYSEMARQRAQNSTRTGQACDRCQARKFKCDREPLGCERCRAANMPCLTTDRVTGVTHQRGELERLKQENQMLREENMRLRQRLAEMARRLEAMGGLGYNMPTIGQQYRTLSPQIGQMNTQLYQPEMLLQQPMPQQGAGLQGQGRGNPLSWNFPSTATQVYQTTPMPMTPQQQRMPQRQSLQYPKQVSPEMLQGQSHSDRSYPNLNAGVSNYPIQQPLSATATAINHNALPQTSPGAPAAAPTIVSSLPDYSTPPDLMDPFLGPLHQSLDQGQNQLGLGGETGGNGYDASAGTMGSALASNDTTLSSTWAMDWPGPQTPAEETYDYQETCDNQEQQGQEQLGQQQQGQKQPVQEQPGQEQPGQDQLEHDLNAWLTGQTTDNADDEDDTDKILGD